MQIDAYGSFFVQVVLFILLAFVLIVSVVSLFIKPAKRTIRASLVEAKSGHIFDISHAETSIGRAKTCDMVIADISVSRFHAVLSRRSKSWMVFDTNSTSGVYVNNQKIDKSSDISDGDRIRFGTSEYVFYSTAVTTNRQQVPKTKPTGDRTRYRKPTASKNPDEQIQYKERTGDNVKKVNDPRNRNARRN